MDKGNYLHVLKNLPKKWKAHYKDEFHDTDIEIINTEQEYNTNPLSFTLDGVTFRGTSLGDFELANEEQYNTAKEKFNILKCGGNYSNFNINTPYMYNLQRYSLNVEIPITAVRKSDKAEICGNIHLAFRYVEHNPENFQQSRRFCDDVQVFFDDSIVSDFSLCVDGRCYKSSKNTLYFESALIDICTQIKDDYYLKCCFTCQYSDYSPYGNDDFGTMLCYCKYKEECLKVNSKDDFFEYLESKDFAGRQETYLCGEYAERVKS